MERIDLPRGRWVRFGRPMYISDKRSFKTLRELPEDADYLAFMEGYAAILEPAVDERSWDGPFDQLTEEELLHVAREWSKQTEDLAVPPESGTGSETP